MNKLNTNSCTGLGVCPKCSRPYFYVGDIPNGGFMVGAEPYCTCGTEICTKCGQRYVPKCEHESQEELR
jgi:hypothetical protein